ncbi:extracellular solute-binding protein [Acutalibacter caecimuris]|uniref:extracellular solute-binding protein n=1 Tax=Acutalibacter caecimuris TaxID=3093657 RepID=UPI002AC90177|nr:extracellular solute-binding protein [Acutalibacter sp. M00118]
MPTKILRPLLGLVLVLALLLSACTSTPAGTHPSGESAALTWMVWNGYDDFLALLDETCPDIELEFIPNAGANRTGYGWVCMRADDTPDIFITSQIMDQELAQEHLADLSDYDFINSFSTSVLDQVAIDGGIYLLPVNYAMYGIFYNQTLMEEHGWALPTNFAELEELCQEIEAQGLVPGVLGTLLTGNSFSAVFNLAKTGWLTTPEGVVWERDFLAGNATAAGHWEEIMDYVQRYIDAGMFTTDPKDRNNPQVLLDYLGNRKAVFCTAQMTVNITELPDTGDKLGIMPFISEHGDKNAYAYSPTSFIGISRRLTEPGNEKKLEQAIRLLSLLFSPQGQATFITEETPCVLSALNNAPLPEGSLIGDAQQAMREGQAFPLTFSSWGILPDLGQSFKEWFRGENGMDGSKCIARMDELQQDYLNHTSQLAFCESTADFTLEETATLVGKALGSASGADAAVIPIADTYHVGGANISTGISTRLYKGQIDMDIAYTICPSTIGEYALMTMTGAQLKALTEKGFDAGDGIPYPYITVVKGGGEPEDDKSYQVAFPMQGYTDETAKTYHAQVISGSLWDFVLDWLKAQKTVSPDGNPWN